MPTSSAEHASPCNRSAKRLESGNLQLLMGDGKASLRGYYRLDTHHT
jgi:hypothetical protein